MGAGPHDDRDLRNPLGRHPGLIEEDAPEMVAIGKTSAWSGRNAPPESTRYTHGSRFWSATSCARTCFFTVMGKQVPPFTVASLATIITSRPETRPTPVMTPADGASLSTSPTCQRGQLQKWRVGVDELRNAIANRQLALLAMAFQILRAAASRARGAVAQLGDQRSHAIAIGRKLR